MNWRAALVLGALTAGLTLTFVPRASADPPPWAGVWRHNKHVNGEWRDNDHDRDDRGYWRRHNDHDWDDHGYWRHERYGRPYYGSRPYYGDYGGRPYYGSYGGYRSYDPQYGKLMDRINNDQAKINEIGPTGRHRKALQWYYDDLRNAQRDMNNYRYQGSTATYGSYYPPPAPPSNPYYPSSGSYDPYYGSTGQSFDWKHDWPLLLGQVLVQGR